MNEFNVHSKKGAIFCLIIITFNSEKHIRQCMESTKKNASEDFHLTYVLIDNASSDNSANIIGGFKGENTKIVRNDNNVGFAKAVNQGLRTAKKTFNSDFYFLLNPDATLDDHCINTIFNFHKKNNFCISSPIILDPETKKPWFCGSRIDFLRQKTLHAEHFNKTMPFKSQHLSGCTMCIPKEVIEKVGFFDERFFLYYEDADFSVRAKNKGVNLFLVPNALCFHKESQSSDKETKCFHLVKSGLLFFEKHSNKIQKIFFWTKFWIRYLFAKFFTKKTCVLKGVNAFLKQHKSYQKTKI